MALPLLNFGIMILGAMTFISYTSSSSTVRDSRTVMVAFNFSFEDLPNFSVGKNGHAHRILRTRLGIEQLLGAQFESVLVDFFQFEN